MNQDDIIRMAREAGFPISASIESDVDLLIFRSVERFANLVAAAEREACAQWLCNNYQDYKNIADICDAIRVKGRG